MFLILKVGLTMSFTYNIIVILKYLLLVYFSYLKMQLGK